MSNQPWTGHAPVHQAARITENPNAPYYLLHSPLQWEFIEESTEWLPQFSELREAAGVNGVQQTKHGTDSTLARVHFQDQGFEIIDYRRFPYMARHRTATGGYFYCSVFAKPKVVGKNTFWSHDTKGWNDWRRSLVTDGYIEPIDSDVCRLLMDRQARQIRRYIRDQHIPEFRVKMDRLKATLDRMEAATEQLAKTEQEPEPEPEPVKRATRKRSVKK